MIEREDDPWNLGKLRGVNGNHRLIDSMCGVQLFKVLKFVDPVIGNANFLSWQPNEPGNLAGGERQPLQPVRRRAGKLVRSDNQQAGGFAQVCSTSAQNPQCRFQDNGQQQQGKDVTNQQSSGEKGVAAEIERGQKNKRCGNTSRPGGACSGPFPKDFIEICNAMVFRDQRPNKRPEHNLAEMPMGSIRMRPIQGVAKYAPDPPPQLEGRNGQQINPYFQQ